MTFSVVATGNAPLSYQWQKNGTALAGATNTAYNITAVSATDAGSYTVVVSNAVGTATSAAATLTVNTVVSISPLTNLVRSVGANAVFGTTASGTGPFSYAWYTNGVVLGGQTNSSLTLTNLGFSDSGVYQVTVSGACGTASSSATLMVDSCFPAVDVMLVIDRSGSMAEDDKYVDARQACSNFVQNLNFSPNADQAGLASFNSSATLNQTLTNNLQALDYAISSLPAASGDTSISLGVQTGQTELLSPRHNPQALPVLLLLTDGLPTGSDTDSNALYTATQAKNAGTLVFTVGLGSDVDPVLLTEMASSPSDYFFATNGTQVNELFTEIATLICRPPTNIFISGLSNLTVCAGAAAEFAATVTATQTNCAPYGYQWLKNGVQLPAQTNSLLVISNVLASDAGVYALEVTSVCLSVTNSATLTVNTPVQIVSAPVDVTTCPGTSAGFSVAATGSALTYQWYMGSNALPGQTGSSLLLANVSAADAGVYGVVVDGMCGDATTNSASLTVSPTVLVSAGPTNLSACPGTSASFNVTATGAGLTYQWYEGTSPLPEQTANILTLANVSAADAGIYSVVVSGMCGDPVTNSANLTVNDDAMIVSAPVNQTNCPGTSASFSVSATGTGLSYQWYKDGSALPGQTGSSLTLGGVSGADAGTYSVTVSGVCGNPASASASLTVNQNVAVVGGPVSLTNCPGDSATFSVSATGTSLSYQWSKGGIPLDGQTGSSLTLNNLSAADAASYSVVVSGVCGTDITESATLTVNENVLVSSAPASLTNCPGDSASFNVSATGTGLSYQWYRADNESGSPTNGELVLSETNALAGQTNSSLVLANVSASDAGTYAVVVSGACGGSVTNSATLTVNEAVLVSNGPVSLTQCPGDSASFSVNATGTALSYQWYQGGSALVGQTGNSLTLANVSAADAGTYSVVVSGTCGNAVTNSASLVVNSPVLVVSAPVSLTNCPGTSASFSVNATGTGLSYQWNKGGNALPGQTGSSLTLSSVGSADAGLYSVVVSGTCGNAVTNSASLTVNQNVAVASAPTSLIQCPGDSATFSVSASGTGLSYQWYKGGTLMPGQSGSSLALNNVSAADAGTYSVTVSGACGNPVSASASLTVNQAVAVVGGPVSLTNCPGDSATFSVSATGTSLSYQWSKGGIPLDGQTGSSLTLNNLSAADAASYSVVVSGVCGTDITESATLTVNENVLVSSAPASLTNCPGDSASFNVSATGTGLSYQWYRADNESGSRTNGELVLSETNALAGQTNSSLVLTNVSAGDAGTYAVVVGGACGASVTNSASLVVNSPVLVVSGPVSLTNCPGTSASFSVNATGTSLSYQWYKAGSALVGQTGSTLTLSGVGSADAALYSVVVSGACGAAVTNSASLVVNSPVLVVSAPVSLTNCPGTSASFSVNATGTSLSYQWYKAGSALVGQTGSTLTLSGVGSADAALYSVVVSGACGAAVTNSASLVVNSPVLVVSGPVSLTNCPGTSASFSVNATGTSLSYQWYKAGSALVGQTGNSLTLANVSAADAGTYSVVVSGACGAAVTNSASLVVNSPVLVVSAPVSLTNCPGTSASFSVNATGTALSYQWYKAGSALVGQTGSTLTLSGVGSADAALYSVVVSGACGAAVTNSASLVVNSPVLVVSAPVSLTNCPGTSASFSVNATGTSLSYQWYKAGSALVGQTGSTLTLSGVGSADAALYSVVVSGACGAAVTNSASLVVNSPVLVVSAPVSLTNCPGTSASFSVNATGTGLSYQWYNGSTALAGQTNSNLTLNTVSAANAGTYSVVVSGVCGGSVTESATLSVNADVLVSSAPASSTNCPGDSASFSVGATGTGLSYQWYRAENGLGGQTNGDLVLSETNALAGQTNSSLVLTNVSAGDAGTYAVVVSGACGASVTNSASLVVNSPVLVVSGPVSLTNCPGTSASFSVNATGTALSYQWYKAGSALVGQTGSTLTLSGVGSADAALYSVVVSGACGAAVTNSASLVVNSPVLVVSAPVSLTNCPGTSASFSVNATGTSLSYQWYKAGSALVGQTGSTLTLSGVGSADAALYSVVVSGACGAAVTNSASLVVNSPVLVVSAPVSLTNCPGTSASFSVNATGTGLSYQWYNGSTALAGQTNSNLTLNTVSAANAGTYSVVVSGVCGGSVTESATLSVNADVLVSSAPASSTNCPGDSASFSVGATGTGLSYQWYRAENGLGGQTNGDLVLSETNALAGQTNSSLVLTNVSAGDAGTYAVVVSGACGASVTNSASLVVNSPVLVVSGPVSLTNCPGTSASFSVNATGTSLSYQWYKAGSALVGQTGSTLTLSGVSAADAALYSVVVSGACGAAVTNSASLVVNSPVLVVSAPVSLTNCPGTSASFSVNATGTALSYQWYKAGSALVGQTGSSLTLSGVGSADAALYSVVVSGACGAAVTNSASLVVNSPVLVVSAPVSLTNCPGTSASFSVNATGTGLSYQWYKAGSALVGQTGSSLTLSGVSAADAAPLQRGGQRGLWGGGDQQRQPDGQQTGAGGQRAGQPDQLPGHQRQLQCERDRHGPELPMV